LQGRQWFARRQAHVHSKVALDQVRGRQGNFAVGQAGQVAEGGDGFGGGLEIMPFVQQGFDRNQP
jgi:hypothetical protein